MMEKASVVSVKKGRATVTVDKKKRDVVVRGDLKLKKGDTVLISFGAVVDKIK